MKNNLFSFLQLKKASVILAAAVLVSSSLHLFMLTKNTTTQASAQSVTPSVEYVLDGGENFTVSDITFPNGTTLANISCSEGGADCAKLNLDYTGAPGVEVTISGFGTSSTNSGSSNSLLITKTADYSEGASVTILIGSSDGMASTGNDAIKVWDEDSYNCSNFDYCINDAFDKIGINAVSGISFGGTQEEPTATITSDPFFFNVYFGENNVTDVFIGNDNSLTSQADDDKGTAILTAGTAYMPFQLLQFSSTRPANGLTNSSLQFQYEINSNNIANISFALTENISNGNNNNDNNDTSNDTTNDTNNSTQENTTATISASRNLSRDAAGTTNRASGVANSDFVNISGDQSAQGTTVNTNSDVVTLDGKTDTTNVTEKIPSCPDDFDFGDMVAKAFDEVDEDVDLGGTVIVDEPKEEGGTFEAAPEGDDADTTGTTVEPGPSGPKGPVSKDGDDALDGSDGDDAGGFTDVGDVNAGENSTTDL